MKKAFLRNKLVANTNRDQLASIKAKESGKMMIKLPIGNVDAALPEGYESQPRTWVESDSRTVDYDEDQIIMTTLPLRFMDETVPVGANTWSECILKSGKQKHAILSIPGFPHSVPYFDPPRYRIGPSAHGKGIFATCDIDLGDLIFAERPAVVLPAAIPVQFDIPYDASLAECIKIQLTEYEKILEICVGRMLPQAREAFFDLYNSHTEDGSGPIFGRIRTNGIEIRIGEDRDEVHSGTFIAASRINHSCIPNVTHRFEQSSFSLRLRAVRPIKAGEELFISYAHTNATKEKRQLELRSYGFQCTCAACSDPNWDTRLALIEQSYANITGEPNKVMKESLRWIKVIEDLQLHSNVGYGVHLLRVGMMALLLGKPEMGKKYTQMAGKVNFAKTGEPLDDILVL
ncbi:hypothetical protein H0H93_016502 [Arthromyces matolae]|nr:hypothetical protein H0H93_016502 [Arthromyces matolae]